MLDVFRTNSCSYNDVTQRNFYSRTGADVTLPTCVDSAKCRYYLMQLRFMVQGEKKNCNLGNPAAIQKFKRGQRTLLPLPIWRTALTHTYTYTSYTVLFCIKLLLSRLRNFERTLDSRLCRNTLETRVHYMLGLPIATRETR